LIRISALALLSAGILLGTPANSENPLPNYGFNVSTGKDTSLILLLNGIPQTRIEAGRSAAVSATFHADVVPGENTVEVLIGTAEIAPRAALNTSDLGFSLIDGELVIVQ